MFVLFLGAFVGALVARRGRGCSHIWERLMLLSSLGAFVGALIAGNGRCCSRRWERLWVAFVGSGRWWILSEVVVDGFRWKRSSVLSSVVNWQW